jgi:hypothetical protein
MVKELGLGGLIGLLLGIGVVSWVEPTTTGGVGLILLVTIVLGTVVGGIRLRGRQGRDKARGAPRYAVMGTPPKEEREKPGTRRFDVFLSHNSHDKPAVRRLKEMLEERGIAVWYDEDQLVPGRNWQPLLERGIEESASGAVVVGNDGLGPWEDEEMQVLLRHAVEEEKPVIPVLLPGAPREPKLPLFLGNRTWVDCRPDFDDENVGKLLWGITGTKPGT